MSTKSTKIRKEDRITVDALKYYVPLFHQGDWAEQKLMEQGEELTPAARNQLQTVMKLKELSVNRIAELSGPLMTREINKIISTSHLRSHDDLFNILYYAGIGGMKRGLRRFEVDKMNASSTNYLFQWIVTYAKKELVALESPFGIPPSRFQRYKKISAVRKRLSDALERYATNDEVYDYFQSGQADMRSMNGRVANKGKPSQANLDISLELIEEQERFEKEMLVVDLMDTQEGFVADSRLREDNVPLFSETAFGVFIDSYNFTDEAKVVLMSDLHSNSFTIKQAKLLEDLPKKNYNRISTQWSNLLKDKGGIFHQFLMENIGSGFSQFDIRGAIAAIEAQNKSGLNYKNLFENESMVKI